MYDFHFDRRGYFHMQRQNAETSVIPFIKQCGLSLRSGMEVLEIGSAEGGVLKAFIEQGCKGTGVELDAKRIEQCREYMREEICKGSAVIYHANIFQPGLERTFAGRFDLIILKDVIEHIHGHDKLIHKLKQFLAPGGRVFFGFPPWHMPFGGHQQICRNHILSHLPWLHLLPPMLYRWVLRVFKEDVHILMEIRQTRISTNRFNRLTVKEGYMVYGTEHFLINPIYAYKFGLRPRKQLSIIRKIPHLRDYVTTCVYYLIGL